MVSTSASNYTAGSANGSSTAPEQSKWDRAVEKNHPMSSKDGGNNQSLPAEKPLNYSPWNHEAPKKPLQTAAVAAKDEKTAAPRGVRVSGSEQDIALFCKQIKETSGLDVRVIDGKLAIIGDDKGKGNKAVAQAIRDSVNSKNGIDAILERDTATFGDSFVKKTVDVGDIQIAMQDNKVLAGALLTHIFVERTYAAEHEQAEFQTAHEAALKREGGVFCDAKGCATEPPGALNHEPGDQKNKFLRLHRVYTGEDGRVFYDAILTQEKTEDGRYVFSVNSKKGR
jgi:hypothetical protein